jgi:hypothetical protein
MRRTSSEGRLGSASSKRSQLSEQSRRSSLRSSAHLVTQPHLTGGGRTQGAIIPSPPRYSESVHAMQEARADYRPSAHGWHVPQGLAESRRLATDIRLPDGAAIPGTWTWTLKKAKDHIGAGNCGIMAREDVSSTMVSADSPDWFCGLRTVAGPFNCNAVPVRRCPKNYIDGKQLRVRARTYEQGGCMDITEHLQDTSRVPTPSVRVREPQWRKDFKGPQDAKGRATSRPATLVGGGCALPAQPLIRSSMVTRDRFEPGNAVQAGKKFCDT